MIMMMDRPMVTQEAWKNNHHADNAQEDDGDDPKDTMSAKLAMLKCKSIYKIDEIHENLVLIM